jgi:hypothetical protein
MKRFNVILCAMSALLAMVVVGHSVRAQQCDDDFWRGSGDGVTWNDPFNWSRGVPVDDKIAVFDIYSETVMDLRGDIWWPSGQPWTVCSWLVGAGGDTKLGAFASWDIADRKALSTLGDVVVNVEDYESLLNTYQINVGPLDGVFVGDGMWDHEPVFDAETYGITWNVQGVNPGNDKAVVGVTGKIGGGSWNVGRSLLCIGRQFADFDLVFGDWYDDAAGTIDSAYPQAVPGASNWTLDMVEMYAKRGQNLDEWTINHSDTDDEHPHTNLIEFKEFFEANRLSFNAGVGQNDTDRFHAWMLPTADIETDGGLHIKDFAIFQAGDGHEYGPQVKVENLRVRDDATLIIDDATWFNVTGEPAHPSYPTANGGARFLDGASLRYGGDGAFQELWFNVDMLGPDAPVRIRENLLFYPDAYIRPLGEPPYVPEDLYNLDLQAFNTSFEIQSVVSRDPAIDWYTGDVDLIMEGQDVDAYTLEVISEDGCNLWFTDVPEPRCLK